MEKRKRTRFFMDDANDVTRHGILCFYFLLVLKHSWEA